MNTRFIFTFLSVITLVGPLWSASEAVNVCENARVVLLKKDFDIKCVSKNITFLNDAKKELLLLADEALDDETIDIDDLIELTEKIVVIDPDIAKGLLFAHQMILKLLMIDLNLVDGIISVMFEHAYNVGNFQAAFDQGEFLLRAIVKQMDTVSITHSYGIRIRHLYALWLIRDCMLEYKNVSNPADAAAFGKTIIEHDLIEDTESFALYVKNNYEKIKEWAQAILLHLTPETCDATDKEIVEMKNYFNDILKDSSTAQQKLMLVLYEQVGHFVDRTIELLVQTKQLDVAEVIADNYAKAIVRILS